MCLVFAVGQPRIEWHGLSDVLPSPSEQDGYVGCQTRISAVAFDRSGLYSVDVSTIGNVPASARTHVTKGVNNATAVLTWVPSRGSEGSSTTVCFTARDAKGALPALESACRTIRVQKCQYCVRAGDTLGSLTKGYGLDTNWLRLWLHNGNSNPAGSDLPIGIDNPDLIVTPERTDLTYDEQRSNALGQPKVYVGPVYAAKSGDSLVLVARRFRTTISGILRVNPDVRGEGDVREGTDLCLIPCAGQELAQ